MTALSELQRCTLCDASDVRLDEKAWCEACVIRSESVAGMLVDSLEDLVDRWLELGYNEAQLVTAVRLSVRDEEGPLPGIPLRRRRCDAPCQRAEWETPPSLFNEPPTPTRRNNIAQLRNAMGLSMEQAAARAGVPVTTLALWEQGVLPTEQEQEAADRVCDVFGCRAGHVFVFNEHDPW